MGAALLPQSLKVKTITYTLDISPEAFKGAVELKERLTKPVTGEGGWQNLMRGIQSQLDGNTLEIPQTLLAKMITMATEYGAGGYQGVIRWILCLIMAQHTETLIGKVETLKTKGAA